MCITFRDKPGEGSMQVAGFKTSSGQKTDAPHNNKIKQWTRESAYNDNHLH
jgi:hypothetical protein